jgi:hypothetical protein
MKIKLSILFFFFCLSANAQLDSTRIKTFNDKLLIGLFVSDNYAKNTFQYGNNQLEQMPTLKPTLGVQFAYNGSVLAIGTGFSLPHFRHEDYEATQTINVNGYFFRPSYVLWGAVRRFKGFDYASPSQVFSNTSMFNLLGSFMYIFNENKYSVRAAFRQADQQLKSGGSWLLKGEVNHYEIQDSNLIMLRGDYFRGFYSRGLAAFGGYGYTLNLNKNWFVSALLLGGVDFQKVSNYTEQILTQRNPTFYSFTPTYDFKSSIGYNSDKFYIALLFDTNNRLIINNIDENINFEYNFLKTDLRFGIRIDAPNFLTKIRFLN